MKLIQFEVTDDVYETLRQIGHPLGSTVTDIAKGATLARARDFGRPFARQVLELHGNGRRMPVSEIAAELGVTNTAVRNEMTRLNLVAWPPRRAQPAPRSPRARKPR